MEDKVGFTSSSWVGASAMPGAPRRCVDLGWKEDTPGSQDRTYSISGWCCPYWGMGHFHCWERLAITFYSDHHPLLKCTLGCCSPSRANLRLALALCEPVLL
jgi:hypothetical protein